MTQVWSNVGITIAKKIGQKESRVYGDLFKLESVVYQLGISCESKEIAGFRCKKVKLNSFIIGASCNMSKMVFVGSCSKNCCIFRKKK